MKKAHNSLDFLIIGAAKSGTTSLYEWMKLHPKIYMPSGKELPFFSEDKLYKKGLDKYLKTYFSGADQDALWGKATPQYMSGSMETMPPVVAERIKYTAPQVKIIVILRNPAERAYSDYKMAVRRGYETRSFNEAIDELLQPSSLKADRRQKTTTNTYVVAGEYGRILNNYFKLFPRGNIKVFFADELREDPGAVVSSVFKFLNIDHSFVPPNIDKSFHKGSAKPKTHLLTPNFIYKIPLIEKIWKNYIPSRLRRRVNFFINIWNTKKSKEDEETSIENSDAHKKLVEHYRHDVNKLCKLIDREIPWKNL